MSVTSDNYDQLKIDKLKLYLQSQADKGQARYYEIFVDNLKAVTKTNEVADFDSYEDYLTDDTERVRILIYTTNANSPRNDQYSFRLKKQDKPAESTGLNGVEIENRIEEKLQTHRERWEHELLKKELEQTKKQLEEAEEYAETLEEKLKAFEGKKFHMGNVNLGEVASVVVEGFVRRNPQLLSKIPGGEGLAGIIEQDNLDKAKGFQHPAENAEVSFQKKQNGVEEAVVLTAEEKGYIDFMRGLAESFDDAEIALLTQIITKLEEKPAQLKTVAELLDINTEPSVPNNL
jgi:hypothetical protein